MAKSGKYRPKNSTEKEFISLVYDLGVTHNLWNAWSDFCLFSSCMISASVDYDAKRHKERSEMFLSMSNKYTDGEINKFSRLFDLLVQALKENPAQDFLGNIYMNLDFGNSWTGQFFTPWSVAEAMSRMTIDGISDVISKNGYASVLDPACGAGAMLMSFAHVCLSDKLIQNYQNKIVFVGQDLDSVVAQMCYIQLSLLGCAGYVVIGNSLTDPVRGSIFHPVISDSCSIWFTPMWFEEVWQTRVLIDYLKHCK